MSFYHVMATACAWTITLLYIYLCVWGLDLRLNNVNYFYWYFPSSIIITSLYWTSETPLSSSITTSEYLICDKYGIPGGLQHRPKMCYEKGGHHGRQTCMITLWRCNFWTSRLAYDNSLLGNIGIGLKDLVSVLITLWRYQLQWLGHSQNLIWFSEWQEKNVWRSFRIDNKCFWKGWEDRSKISCTTWIESMTTIILEIVQLLVTWLIPHLIEKSSASVLSIML